MIDHKKSFDLPGFQLILGNFRRSPIQEIISLVYNSDYSAAIISVHDTSSYR